MRFDVFTAIGFIDSATATMAWLPTFPWKSPSARRYPPIAEVLAFLPAIPCAPRPIWACRWPPSPSRIASAISVSTSTPTAFKRESRSPGARKAFWLPKARRRDLTIEDRPVAIRAWRYDLEGVTGHTIPIYFLDTNLEENDPRDRALTDHLYGGDGDYRLRQEAVLGMGGARILAALDYKPLVYHMNEGHAALLTVALLEQQLQGAPLQSATDQDLEAVRQLCVFTTHTPVPAGHDRFSAEQAVRILGNERTTLLERVGAFHDELLNMTYLALRFSRFVNGVAMQHGIVSREMFPEYSIEAITNGVHAATWTSPAIQSPSITICPAGGRTISRYAMPSTSPKPRSKKHTASPKQTLIAAVKDARASS